MKDDVVRTRYYHVAYPVGVWPAEMRAETAAAYVDEVSVNSFLSKVDKAIYSQPVRMNGCRPKWNREKLDMDLRRRHNLTAIGGEVVEDIADLI